MGGPTFPARRFRAGRLLWLHLDPARTVGQPCCRAASVLHAAWLHALSRFLSLPQYYLEEMACSQRSAAPLELPLVPASRLPYLGAGACCSRQVGLGRCPPLLVPPLVRRVLCTGRPQIANRTVAMGTYTYIVEGTDISAREYGCIFPSLQHRYAKVLTNLEP